MNHRLLAALVLAPVLAGCTLNQVAPVSAPVAPASSNQAPPSAQHSALIASILADAPVEAAIEMFEHDRHKTLATMIDLNQIPAPPFQEQARAAALPSA